MSDTVLFTGGSGLLSLNWAMAIQPRFAVVLGLHERSITLGGVRTVQLDLESVDSLAQALEESQPDVVIHTAGLTDIEKCEAMPDQARHVNVELAANVAQATAKLGVRLVHISTDHLFSGDVPFVDENGPVAPRNMYGRTKAEAEVRVLDACPRALVIRTNFYGWGPSYRQSFTDVIIDALRSGKQLTLFKDVFYTPILVEVAASAVHALIGLGASGIFNVVSDDRISKYQFGLQIAQQFGLDASLIAPGSLLDQAGLVQRPFDMSLSNRKVRDQLGRSLGGVGEHVARLQRQEQHGLSQKIRRT